MYDLLCQGRFNLFEEFWNSFDLLIDSEMENIKSNPAHLICIIPSQSLDFQLSEQQRFAIAHAYAKSNYKRGERKAQNLKKPLFNEVHRTILTISLLNL